MHVFEASCTCEALPVLQCADDTFVLDVDKRVVEILKAINFLIRSNFVFTCDDSNDVLS